MCCCLWASGLFFFHHKMKERKKKLCDGFFLCRAKPRESNIKPRQQGTFSKSLITAALPSVLGLKSATHICVWERACVNPIRTNCFPTGIILQSICLTSVSCSPLGDSKLKASSGSQTQLGKVGNFVPRAQALNKLSWLLWQFKSKQITFNQSNWQFSLQC